MISHSVQPGLLSLLNDSQSVTSFQLFLQNNRRMSSLQKQENLYHQLLKRNSHNLQVIQLYSKTISRRQQKAQLKFAELRLKAHIVTEEVRSPSKNCIALDIGEQRTTESSLKDLNFLHQPSRVVPTRLIKPTRKVSKDFKPQTRKKVSLDIKAPLHLQNVVFRMMHVQKQRVNLKKKNAASLPLLYLDRLTGHTLMEFTFKQN